MKILFVCSGNIFRSFSAESLSNKFLKDNNITDFEISSAGTNTTSDPPYPQTIERIKHYGGSIDHQKTQLTEGVCRKADIIICMINEHQDYVKKLGFNSFLFNEIAYHKKDNLYDEAEYGQLNGWDFDITEYIYDTVDYIYKSIPILFENLPKIHERI